MKKINIILILLLMINSCDQYKQQNTDNDKPQKDEAAQTEEVKKTPEKILKEKLNDTEKINLNFLKEALNNESDFNKFLSYDESAIKSVLQHIQSELSKCTGENASDQKNTFKQTLQGSFKSNSDDLDKFKDQATSACAAGG
ncbi:Mlp family lipoprotein [Borrelia persica]|uniref:Mlp family lipoprotein n=1 Tax=Borrelia persica TaxID=44448 RepID=UPI000462F9B2|nr:Mlp family lipoprotein [Borrelia persica]